VPFPGEGGIGAEPEGGGERERRGESRRVRDGRGALCSREGLFARRDEYPEVEAHAGFEHDGIVNPRAGLAQGSARC